MTCREYTLNRDEKSTDPKGWIRGNTKIGPVLEVTTSYLQGKYGVEIRIESVNKDNSHSWVRISHGLNKLGTDLIDKEYDDNEQETFETKTEVFALKTNELAFASRSKAKAKTRRLPSACSSTRNVPDGAIEFWRVKEYLRNDFENSQRWSDEIWKSKMQGGGGNKKKFQYCTDSSGQEILYYGALQGHSGRNPIDPSLQGYVLIPDNFF